MGSKYSRPKAQAPWKLSFWTFCTANGEVHRTAFCTFRCVLSVVYCPGMRMPSQRSQASQLNYLLFEVAAVATPQVAYSFVTKKRSALHTFDRAGSDAGTRRETKSQLSRGSCLREKVSIHAQRFRNPYTPLSRKWSCLWPVRRGCLGIRPHGIRRSLAKTGTNPAGEPSRDSHNGTLLAPGRRDPVENLFEHRVTGQRAPGGFDEQVADTTGALAADMAAPHGGA